MKREETIVTLRDGTFVYDYVVSTRFWEDGVKIHGDVKMQLRLYFVMNVLLYYYKNKDQGNLALQDFSRKNAEY